MKYIILSICIFTGSTFASPSQNEYVERTKAFATEVKQELNKAGLDLDKAAAEAKARAEKTKAKLEESGLVDRMKAAFAELSIGVNKAWKEFWK